MNKKPHILIVDDDPRNIRILYEILGDDFDLRSSSDGEQALKDVAAYPPDIILLDIMMPGIDGYEVCHRLKSSSEYQNIKIILVSGKALTEERLKGYESGADDFVTKPFDMDEILAKVNVFAKLKSMEEVNKLKTDFLSLISHEMGTPLNHIIGISDLLIQQGGLDDSVSSSIEDVGSSARNLGDKINKILFLARLKQSTVYNTIAMDMHNLMSDVSQLLGDPPGELDVKFEISNGVILNGDYELMQKLFIYLLSTAINRSSDTVVCRITPANNSEQQEGIAIDIEDSGKHLSDSQRDNYFDPFYIEDIMLHDEGLNITMGICAQIVFMHQGVISIRNQDTIGTCISIWLPVSV